MTKLDKVGLVGRVAGGLALVMVPFLVVSACGKKKDASAGVVAPTATATPTWPTATVPPAPPPTTVPDAGPVATTGPGLDGVTTQVMEIAIEQRAKAKEAPNMKPVGSLFGANVSQGGETESPVMMIDMGKCYSVVAQGGPGITELDIKLVSSMPLPAGMQPVLAVDNTSGPQAAISPCWKNALPIGFPAKIILSARGGSGPVAGKLYVK